MTAPHLTNLTHLIYGFHAVQARMKQDASTIHELYVEQSRHDKRMQTFLQQAEQYQVRVILGDKARLDGIAGTTRHQGVVARVATLQLKQNLYEILETANLVLVLDQITDPHNLGACLRTADAAGVDVVIAPKDKAVGLTPIVRKVASGAAEHVPYLMVTNLARTLTELAEEGFQIVGTAGDAPATMFDVDYRPRTAIVMGAEGEGMRRLTRDKCDQLVHIPMHGTVDSLNVSVATGVLLFEVMRQRRSDR